MAYQFKQNDYLSWSKDGRSGQSLSPAARANYEQYLYEQAQAQKAVDALKADYEAKYNEAKTANESRYADILSGYDERYNTAAKTLEGMGDAEKKVLASNFNRVRASASQGLINSGLYSSTIVPSVMTSIGKQESESLGSLNENLRQQRLSIQAALSGDKLKFMENREDTYPSLELYLQQLQQYGNTVGAGYNALTGR